MLRVTSPHCLYVPDNVRVICSYHALDSLVVGVPDSGVALLGDCLYAPPYRLRREGDTTDFGMVRKLLAERHEWYVDAHSAPRNLASMGPQDET
jgi:glyoxylase-like metal-dependent hydrolase (beta-lactamase superfamily II)